MSTRRFSVGAASFVLFALACGACGGTQPEASTSQAPAVASTSVATTAAIADLWRARCSQCHVRVEPGTRDRSVLAPALERHKKRARLTESDVGELVDFLAK